MERETPMSHLQYTNDWLLLLDGGKEDLLNLISKIHCFELAIGTKIDWKKSWIVGINSNLEEYDDIANDLNFQIQKLPFRYLGAPLGGSPWSKTSGFLLLEDEKRN